MRRVQLVAASLAASLIASIAWAAIGAEVTLLQPGEKVASTLTAEGDQKIAAFAGVEGSTLSIAVKALKGSNVVPALSLFAPDGTPVDIGVPNPKSGGVAKAGGIKLGATGVWRIAVGSPSGRGGAFELSAKAKVPVAFSWKGAIPADGMTDHAVPAAPGGSITVAVNARTIFAPVVELLAPSGATVAQATGIKGRVVLAPVRLDEIGRYTVRLSGGDGAFSAKAVVKPAAKRRTLEFRDVESRPDILSFTPATTSNQTTLSLHLDGVGFTSRQTVALSNGAQFLAATTLDPAGFGSANAELDLTAVPPGRYSVRVATPSGNFALSRTEIEVTNRAPSIGIVTPADVWNRGSQTFTIHGAGFDATASASVRHRASDLVLGATPGTRSGHDAMDGSVVPPDYLVGPCDVTVKDPDGSSGTLSAAIDLVGRSRAGGRVKSLAYNASSSFAVLAAAVDETRAHALLVVQYTPSETFDYVLVDLATLTVIDTIASSQFLDWAAVAYDPVSDNYGICRGSSYSGGGGPVVVTLLSAADPRVLQGSATVGGPSYRGGIAADPVDGGFLATYDYIADTTHITGIGWQVVTANGLIDPTRRGGFTLPAGDFVQHPGVAYAGDGAFLVAFGGNVSMSPYYDGLWTMVIGNDGQVRTPRQVVAQDSGWSFVALTRVARDPGTGAFAVGFTHVAQNSPTSSFPAFVRLAPGTLAATPPRDLDQVAGAPLGGIVTTVAWNPERGEFVAAHHTPGPGLMIRRIQADGTLRDGFGGVEGFGFLYCGAAPGSFGIARVFDGTDDGISAPASTGILVAELQPLR